jgi:hypothetical protein
MKLVTFLLLLLVNYPLQGKVSLISTNGVHQLHIFIFVLAVFHVVYSVATMALARLKVSPKPLIPLLTGCYLLLLLRSGKAN